MVTSLQSKKANWLLATILLSLGFSANSKAQTSSTASLIALKGYTQNILFSDGREERAKNIAEFIEDASIYFQQAINFTPKATIYVLAPSDWSQYAAQPLKEVYGFPHNVDDKTLVIASDDNPFWQSYLPPLPQLPDTLQVLLKKAYQKKDGSLSMMPFFDLLALHELGHSYTNQAGLKM